MKGFSRFMISNQRNFQLYCSGKDAGRWFPKTLEIGGAAARSGLSGYCASYKLLAINSGVIGKMKGGERRDTR